MPVSRSYKVNKTARAKKRKRAIRCIAIGLLLLAPLWLFQWKIRPIIQVMGTNEAKLYATNLINEAVQKEIYNSAYDYNDLIHIQYNSAGQISSIQANTIQINRLHTSITAAVNNSLAMLPITKLYISVGNFFNMPFFANRGPKISIQVLPQGNLHTQVISSLNDAGINQTIHRLTYHLSVSVTNIIPGCSSQAQIDLDYPLAETVIVGSVPNFYAKVLSDKTESVSQDKSPSQS